MRAFITGITGFVGGHLAEHLLAKGDAVLGLSASGAWPETTPALLRNEVAVLRCALGSDDVPGDVLAAASAFAPDCIYHLAAISVPSECGDESPTARAITANVLGTRSILRLAVSLAKRPRGLLVSTSHVYAPPHAAAERFAESARTRPKNAYGKTKLMAESVVRKMVRDSEVDVVIARAFQHAGPRQSGPMMLPEWIAQFAHGENEPVVVRNRDTWIDLSDVRDVVRAYRLLVLYGATGDVFNVGSGVARRTGEVLDLLRDIAGPDRPIVETRPGERFDAIADITKLQEATGWRAEIPLEQTVRDAWTWRHP